ncbi:ARM repeat-containing protein [Poronia punctata]|nr:ARM repeat-containing protein [Poronia punctata]
MTNKPRPNGFPYSVGNNDKRKPGTFSSSGWQTNNNIWADVDGSLTTRRDPSISRESEELSPTAPSGSAQLNGHSEAAPWPPRRNHNAASASPSISPIKPLQIDYTPSAIPIRLAPSKGGNLAPGPPDMEGSFLNNVDDRNIVGGEYRNGMATQYGISETPRRNSADPSFLRGSTNRGGAHGQFDQYFGAAPYPGSSNLMRPQPRASVSNPPVSAYNNESAHFSLNSTLSRGLARHESSEPSNGYPTTNEQFSTDPNSLIWGQAAEHSMRVPGHGVEQDTTYEIYSLPQLSAVMRGTDRSSPAGNGYGRPVNASGSLSGTAGPRLKPWPLPVPRNNSLYSDFDGQRLASPYSQQAGNFYPQYNNQQGQFPTQWEDPYAQANLYRSSLSGPVYRPNGVASRDKDVCLGPRSVLLEQFRHNLKSNKRYELKDITGHVVEFCGDQHGSRFLQEKLQIAKSEEKDRLFAEIQKNLIQLMKDLFGNYVIQKFFEYGSQAQKTQIARQMKGKVAELSNQMYSCRVVQKALDHVLVEQQQDMIEELRPYILEISKNPNGNHVIQKVVEVLPAVAVPLIMEAFRGQVDVLGQHNYACRVIQRVLEYGTPAERRTLMTDLHACTARLITDQFGNYVIQHIIENGEPEERGRMIQYVMDRALQLSKHKFASNVVEKCIICGTDEERRAFRDKFTTPAGDASPLSQLIKDQFGNYVIQRLVEYFQGGERLAFVEELRPHIACSKRQGAGTLRQVVALEKKISESLVDMNINGSSASATTAPSTPSLVVEVSSEIQTPSLTTELNSPDSPNAPSTSISTTGDSTETTTQVSRLAKVSDAIQVEGQTEVN